MSFLYPYYLLFLLVPLLLAAAAAVLHVRRGNAWRSLVSSEHPELVTACPPWRRILPAVAVMGALVLGIIALARPVAGFSESSARASGRNLFIALDVSRSMLTDDVTPSRLEQARAAALELLDALPGDKIGLIVFAGDSDVVVPLTYDHRTLRDVLQRVDAGWAGYGGTNFGLLLKCALDSFSRSAPGGGNALVIFSDGEDTVRSKTAAADEARKKGMHVITVGVGTTGGAPIPDPSADGGLWRDAAGKHVISKMNAEFLLRFSKETGGVYFSAGSGADITQFARAAVQDLKKHEEEFSINRVPKDIFAFFAAPALVLLVVGIVLGTRLRLPSRSAAVLLMGLITLAGAAEPERVADYEQALRLKDPAAAKEAYSRAMLSEDPSLQAAARLGMTNIDTKQSFEKLRQLYEGKPAKEGEEVPTAPGPSVEELTQVRDALRANAAAYDDALKLDPHCAAAAANKAAVQDFIRKIEQEIERLSQQQQQEQQQNEDQQQNQKDPQDQQDDKQDKQDQKDSQGQQDDKKDKQDRKDSQGQQDDKKDKQDQKDSQGQQDDKKDKQDQKDSQGQQDDKKDKQDQKDSQGQQDDKKDKQDQKDSQGKQAPESPSPAEPLQESDKDADKEKQRAFSTLQIHADEEDTPTIPGIKNRRPPEKDY